MKNIISVIGIGDSAKQGLSQNSIKKVEEAEVLVGGERILSFFCELKSRKVPIKKNLSKVFKIIQAEAIRKKVVVLVSGDPFFYGIGKRLLKNLAEFKLEFFPHPSSIQLAFARIGENWDNAFLTSVHAGDMNRLVPIFRKHQKIGILTDYSNTPAKIATLALDSVGDVFICHVCENLGGQGERITKGSLRKIMKMNFSPLNVVVMRKKTKTPPPRPLIGIPDKEFKQRRPLRGLITKSETRAVSLSKMDIRPDSIIWDVGAGSGSVSIEAASLAGEGRVYAMEKNEKDIKIIQSNIKKFSTPHIIPLKGVAPDCFREIEEDPDVLFVGGSGGRLKEILEKGVGRLREKGRFVINIIAIENLNLAIATLKNMDLSWEVVSVNIARSRGIESLTRLESLNTVFIVHGAKTNL